jgi:ElaB/YqjD/DUF883 family membrane-anchored ribosome-binding protein
MVTTDDQPEPQPMPPEEGDEGNEEPGSLDDEELTPGQKIDVKLAELRDLADEVVAQAGDAASDLIDTVQAKAAELSAAIDTVQAQAAEFTAAVDEAQERRA